MQLARQVAALIFPHILQMGGQLGQCGRTLTHLRFKQVSLALQCGLLANAGGQQGLGLQQVHIERQQTRKRHDGHANAGKLKRFGDLALSHFHSDDARRAQFGRLFPDGGHLLLPDIGGQHELPCLVLAALAHPDTQVEFGQLA